MPTVIKDLVDNLEVSPDIPVMHGGSSPTWTKYRGQSLPKRITGDTERPNEEAVSQEVLDNREVQASAEMNFQQMIMEDADSNAIYSIYSNAADNNQSVWLRRDGVAADAVTEIIGGKLGFTVTIAKQRQGRDGHRIFVVNYSAVEAFGGDIIQVDTS